MSTDQPLPHADPADVVEQQKDAVPPVDDEDVPDPGSDEVPLEADEADVAEQRIEVSGGVDDEIGES